MSKKIIISIIFLSAILSVGIFFVFKNKNKPLPITINQKPIIEEKIEEVAVATTTHEKEIDTSDWKTYRNEEYGFELKYPEDWVTEKKDEKVFVYSKGSRQELPEGGSAVIVEASNISLNEFIDNYNKSDGDGSEGFQFSKIINEQKVTLNGRDVIKLTGTTAMGINENFIFINSVNRSYILSFHDFDIMNYKILSTFKIF